MRNVLVFCCHLATLILSSDTHFQHIGEKGFHNYKFTGGITNGNQVVVVSKLLLEKLVISYPLVI